MNDLTFRVRAGTADVTDQWIQVGIGGLYWLATDEEPRPIAGSTIIPPGQRVWCEDGEIRTQAPTEMVVAVSCVGGDMQVTKQLAFADGEYQGTGQTSFSTDEVIGVADGGTGSTRDEQLERELAGSWRDRPGLL